MGLRGLPPCPQGVWQSVKKWMLSHSLVRETITGSNLAKGHSTHYVGGPMFANKKKGRGGYLLGCIMILCFKSHLK
jgi:hypothetical protein